MVGGGRRTREEQGEGEEKVKKGQLRVRVRW